MWSICYHPRTHSSRPCSGGQNSPKFWCFHACMFANRADVVSCKQPLMQFLDKSIWRIVRLNVGTKSTKAQQPGSQPAFLQWSVARCWSRCQVVAVSASNFPNLMHCVTRQRQRTPSLRSMSQFSATSSLWQEALVIQFSAVWQRLCVLIGIHWTPMQCWFVWRPFVLACAVLAPAKSNRIRMRKKNVIWWSLSCLQYWCSPHFSRVAGGESCAGRGCKGSSSCASHLLSNCCDNLCRGTLQWSNWLLATPFSKPSKTFGAFTCNYVVAWPLLHNFTWRGCETVARTAALRGHLGWRVRKTF